MEISAGSFDDHGVPRVGLRIQESEDDPNPLTCALSPELARQVAFGLLAEADKLDPPIWMD